MIDCIYNSQPVLATIVYKDGSVEQVKDIMKVYINENTYILKGSSGSIILTLSDVVKIFITK